MPVGARSWFSAHTLSVLAARLVPAGRRDWVEAVWAEAPEAPPGLRRLAWRAGGVRLIAREALMRRGIGSATLFAVAAAVAAWAAWPSTSASFATPVDRVDVIAMVLLLAGLPLLARWFFGPPDNRPARRLRVGCYAAIVALIPAKAAVEQFAYTPPRAGADRRVYLLITGPPGYALWGAEIFFLVVMALYVTGILWMTSRRSRVAPATLAVGTGAGIALGLVMYAVAPLGLSNAATNPWLPGSDIDPLVLLAWLLVLFGPVAAAVVADRRYTASSSSPPPAGARIRQVVAAGFLVSLVGALFVTVLGTGTTAVMLNAAWLRNWLYHGHHLLYGVQNLSADLRTLPAIAYSHELTGSVDASVFLAICIAFPLIGFGLTVWGALSLWGNAPAGRGGPRRGGGPPGPEPAPDSPDGGRLAGLTDDAAGLAVGLAGVERLRVPDASGVPRVAGFDHVIVEHRGGLAGGGRLIPTGLRNLGTGLGKPYRIPGSVQGSASGHTRRARGQQGQPDHNPQIPLGSRGYPRGHGLHHRDSASAPGEPGHREMR
jgi:hypothetical protein